MSILFFSVSQTSAIATQVSLDALYSNQLDEKCTVYRVDTDVNTMTTDELQEYLPAFHKAPDDFVEMSGISLYQGAH